MKGGNGKVKKKYEKPMIVIESFQLDAAVAGTCKETAEDQGYTYVKLGFGENTCSFDNGQFYNYNNCQVDLTGPEGDGNDSLCYHGPGLANLVFVNS